jgi:hypothetical protein
MNGNSGWTMAASAHPTRLRTADPPALHRAALLDVEGILLRLPSRFKPDGEAMRYHRERVFAS